MFPTARRMFAQGSRWIVRRPLSSLTSALCLGVGIAACGLAWTLLDATILRPFGLRDTDRLVILWETDPAHGRDLIEVSLPNFHDWQRASRTLESMAAFGSSHWPALARIGGDTMPLVARAVSVTFFDTIQIAPAIGRTFTTSDLQASSPLPIVLSHRLWRARFGGDPRVVGQSLFLDGADHLIVGVMPRGFGYPDDPDAWIGVERALDEALAAIPEPQRRAIGVLEVIGRRRAGISNAEVRDEIGGIVRSLRQRHAATDLETRAAITPFTDVLLGRLGARLWIAVMMALSVWLFACANVASVRFAQARERATELAARAYLGASRSRIAMELSVECVPIVLIAAASAVAMWFALIAALASSAVIGESGVDLFEQRGVSLAMMALVALVSWIAVGVIPGSLQARAIALTALVSSHRASSRSRDVGAPLLLTQATLAIAVVAVAAVSLQAFDRLSRIELGFATRGVTLVDISVPTWKYATPDAARALLGRLEQGLRQVPGAFAVGAVSVRPFRFGEIADGQPVRRSEDVGVQVDNATAASRVITTHEYFDALGLPIVEGRAFTVFDRADTPAVAIVSRTLARALWGDQPAVGRRLDTFTVREQWRSRLVVGIAGDARYRGLERPSMEVYVPDTQAPAPIGSFVIRHAAEAPLSAPVIRDALRRVEPEIALERVLTTGELHRSVLGPSRLLAILMTVLGGAAVLLLALGIFGAAATALRAAWGEIAIRQAVGAMPFQAARAPLQVLSRALLAGVGLGLLLTPIALSSIEAMGATPGSGVTLPLAAATLIVCTSAAAAIWPCLRRASRVSPAELLRQI